MRIVFMGTPDFSVPALEALLEAGHEIAAVVTQPDKPKGRGGRVQMTPVKLKALEKNIPVYQPVKVKTPEFTQLLRELAPEVIVVIAFGQILSKEILDIPPFGCVNIHASLLPKYRGAAPIQWAVIDGEKESGVTTMQMDVGLDTGDMLEKAVVPIAEDETGGSLHDKLSRAGAALILTTLEGLKAGTITPVPQTEEGTCYARMLDKALGDIDWTMPASAIERLIRGLNPWPSAYTSWNGKTIKLWQAVVAEGEPSWKGTLPGQVVRSDRHSLVVAAGEGFLSIRELQIEGKKRMDVEAFLRGCSLSEGSVLKKKESE
ncbi:MAG: methionyl-tRNA formyltransferase [Clostridiales bacterium]|nr:methionyl-tRNA formyltransferase [Clostridiales bacterium]